MARRRVYLLAATEVFNRPFFYYCFVFTNEYALVVQF